MSLRLTRLTSRQRPSPRLRVALGLEVEVKALPGLLQRRYLPSHQLQVSISEEELGIAKVEA